MATEYEWEIQGYYGDLYGWEMVTTEESAIDAQEQLRSYRENEPNIRFRIRKVKVEAE